MIGAGAYGNMGYMPDSALLNELSLGVMAIGAYNDASGMGVGEPFVELSCGLIPLSLYSGTTLIWLESIL